MPEQRPERPKTGEVGGAAVGVSQMAALCRLSRSRFHALVRAGVFPTPRRVAGRRPHYANVMIRQCLDIRRTGVGVNGQVVMFNRRRGGGPER